MMVVCPRSDDDRALAGNRGDRPREDGFGGAHEGGSAANHGGEAGQGREDGFGGEHEGGSAAVHGVEAGGCDKGED